MSKNRYIEIVRRDLTTVWVLASIAVPVGLVLNQVRDEPMPLLYQSKEARLKTAVEKVASVNATSSAGATVSKPEKLPEVVSLADFQDLVKNKHATILDARPNIFYRLGHVPGALSLPREEFEDAYFRLKSTLERDKGQPLVIYCSSTSCEDAEMVRTALVSLSYTQVAVFKGGWTDWTGANGAEEK